jgi:hypothetical protein
MSYKNKTYVAFDGDTDIRYYRTMQMWKQNDHIDFNFYDAHDLNSARDTSTEESIKAQLRIRMANSVQMILLVGEKTKYLRKFVPWEIELARKKDIPIIIVNLNGDRYFDDDRCPNTVKDNVYTISIPFQMKIIRHALDQFPSDYSSRWDRHTKGHNYHYNESIYTNLGL